MTPTSLRIHGLDGHDTAPDWPPLRDADVARMLARYPGLDNPQHILWRSPRPYSAAARVRCGGTEVFVKRHHQRIRSVATLAEEHAFMAHLREHGLPVPEVLRDSTGHTALADGAWTWEVHTLACGMDVYRDTMSWSPLTAPGQARAAGRMLGRLHRAAQTYAAPQRSTHVLVSRDDLLRAPDLASAIAAQCRERPGLAAYLDHQPWPRAIARIEQRHRQLQPLLADLPTLWTHNDWHVSNLFWSGPDADADVAGIVDFGLCARTFALYDLATAIERNAIAWMQLERGADAVHAQTARAIVDGYTAIRPLDAEQRQLLRALLPIVHLDFALSEIEYFQSVTHSAANAELAWHTFFLGHAAWFDDAPGQTLLQAIVA